MNDTEFKELISAQAQLISAQAQQLSAQDSRISELTGMVGKFISNAPEKADTPQKNMNKGKDDEMRYYIPKGCSLFQRKDDGRWVGRIMIDGKAQTVACRKDKKYVYTELRKAYAEKNKPKPKPARNNDITLFAWLDQWHRIFRLPKKGTELSESTILSDQSIIRKTKLVFKDKKLTELTGDYIQETLNSMGENRMSEGIYTVLKLALEKAKDRTNRINIMTLVEKPRHERVRGRALTKDEIDAILKAARNETERDIIKFYIYTGCRASELINTLVEFVNLSDESRIITNLKNKSKSVPDMTLLPNEVLIYGTKTKGSIRTMPIMPPLKPVLERLTANRDGKEKLFGRYTYAIIRDFYKLIKEKTEISFTLKDFRHTAATSFKDAGIPSSVYFRWFGWCDETMSRRVYTHETEYEKKLSQEYAAKFQ